MALLYQAELKPSKLELIEAWLPGQAWYEGPATAGLERVAAYRFDDPAGAVGVETLLARRRWCAAADLGHREPGRAWRRLLARGSGRP